MVATTPNQAAPRPWYMRLGIAETVMPLLLAALLIWAVTESLAQANWAAGLEILSGIALLGLLVGTLFARIAWLPGWLAHLLAMGLGVALAVQRAGPTVVRQASEEFGALRAERLASWADYAAEIVIRGLVWGRTLAAGGRGEDIVLFVVTLALIAWVLGYSTAWMVFREGRSWLAAAAGAGIILINYTYTYPKPTTLFFVFLAAALLLVVYQQSAGQRRQWHAARIEFPDLLSWRFLLAASLMLALVIGGTALLPTQPTSEELARFWRVVRSPITALREGWQDAFSTINAPAGATGSFLTRNARVGGPRQLGTAVVMRVRTPQYSYWRATAFDRYTGRMWQNGVGERARAALNLATAEAARTTLEPGMAVQQAELRGRTLVTTTVELAQARTDGLVMIGGALGTANIPLLVQHGYFEAGDQLLANFTELASVATDAPLEETTVYTVSTYLSVVDETSLRLAGDSYPAWVNSYLQLPETLPQRVREQASEIVTQAGAENAYDKALAIQQFLRTLRYDERRPVPPEAQDWVDWFVFDGRAGYCDDFATAMVVLLRAEGVPARWVQGYAGGELDLEQGGYVVRESVAHSWPEVYFPGYGWQRFEPTPAPYADVPVRPVVANPDELEPGLTPDSIGGGLSDPDEIMRRLMEQNQSPSGDAGDLAALQAEAEARARAEQLRQLATSAVVVALLLLLGGAVWLALRYDLRGLTPATAAYARMARLAELGGVSQDEGTTPHEYGREIGRRVAYQRHVVDRIVGDYVAERYRGRGERRAVPEEDWAALRRDLLTLTVERLGGMLRRPERPRRGPRGGGAA